MTAIFPAELPPVDACPSCDPGEHPATAPLSVEDAGGDTLASYQAVCGTAWQTRFDEFGWVIDRTTAPAAPERQAAA